MRVCKKGACKDGEGMGKKMAHVQLACHPASARLNTVRCGGGMTPFSHNGVAILDIDRRERSANADDCDDGHRRLRQKSAS